MHNTMYIYGSNKLIVARNWAENNGIVATEQNTDDVARSGSVRTLADISLFSDEHSTFPVHEHDDCRVERLYDIFKGVQASVSQS